jgi:hypothetical protein
MQLNGTALAMVALLLTACAPSAVTANTDLSGTKEPRGMEQPTNPEQLDTPTAAQLLEGLLRLIESSDSVKDFTPERVEAELGMRVEVQDERRWGSSQQLTQDWWANAAMYPYPLSGAPTFSFQFGPAQPDTRPAMTPICSMDLEQFGRRLVQQGMRHETNYGEHGMPLSERYSRPGLEVEISGRQEADQPESLSGHMCLELVLIH